MKKYIYYRSTMKQKGIILLGIIFAGSAFAASCLAFSDVQDSTKFKTAIEYVQDRGIVKGYSDNTYRPKTKINRYDFTKIIIAARFSQTEIDACEKEKYSFPDVSKNKWFSPYICVAKKNGIVNGYNDGLFRGQNNIATAEAIKIILETYEEEISPSSHEEWYAPYLSAAQEMGLLDDVSSSPAHLISRGEMAQLIYTLEKTDETEEVDPTQDEEDDETEEEEAVPKEEEKGYKNVLTTLFWVGEGEDDSNGYISNIPSAWDENWMQSFGGLDDPYDRCGYNPCGFTPKENPFYFALPYNDIDDDGERKESAKQIPWYEDFKERGSVVKNQWIEISYNGKTCYGQWEDVGPFHEDDFDYVFGNARHKNTSGVGAGLDLSPALFSCLGMTDNEYASWRFIDREDIPNGPWNEVETTSDTQW